MMSLEIKKAAILSVTLVGRLQRADLQARNDLAYQTTGGGTWVEREGTERRGEGQAFQYACMYAGRSMGLMERWKRLQIVQGRPSC